jgi:hypothetical protein
MITEFVGEIISAATGLLASLGEVFTGVVELIYVDATITELGLILLATAGFALAWSGIRFVFGFVNRLLNKTRAGR